MERRTLLDHPPPSCTRGPEEFRPKLHLARSPRARSVLQLTLSSGATCEVSLPARYIRLLLVNAEAWHEDDSDIEAFRGFRSNEGIAARLTDLSPSSRNKPFDPETVPVYVYEIKILISRAVSSLQPDEPGEQPAPVLLENLRSTGYRIAACGLDIVPPRPLRTPPIAPPEDRGDSEEDP